MRRVRRWPVLALLAAAVAGGCRGPLSGPAAAGLQSGGARGANVLLVTVDTLRRDRVGAYGSGRGLTPAIDRIAARGVRYTRAYAHASMTLPSHASILTGRTPPRHGLRNNGAFRLAPDVPTLATELQARGYDTAAFIGAFVLDARFGLNRGFQTYDDRLPSPRRETTFRYAERRAGEVVQAAEDWIATRQGRPWLAWVHLFDPHAPYEAPAEFTTGREPYDAEVAYADAMLDRLLARVTGLGLATRTLVVVTADHGEALGDHGESTHGLFAYDATIGVPLVIAGPGVSPGVLPGAVGHADILPTVLDVLGWPAPAGVSGVSLTQSPSADREVYFEAMDAYLSHGWAPLTGVASREWKLIDVPEPELYHLADDPGESVNLVTREPATAQRLDRQRRAVLASTPASPPRADRDAEGDRRLRALGYVATSGAVPVAGEGGTRPDPKRLVAVHERFTRALDLFSAGKPEDALGAFREILQQDPGFIAARTSAATVLLDAGRAREAVALLEAAPPAARDTPDLQAKLGVARREAGDLAGARTVLEAVRAAGWQQPELLNDLGVVYAKLGRADEARALFTSLAQAAPRAADVWNNLGVLELSAGRTTEAAAAFRRAVDADSEFADAWQGLGAALVERDRAAAIEAWRTAERLRPSDFDLLYNLGMVLVASHRPAEAVPYLTRFAREAPTPKYARDRAQVLAVLRTVSR